MKGTLRLRTLAGDRFDSGRFLSTFRHRLEALGATVQRVPGGMSFSDWAILGRRFPLTLEGSIQIPKQTEPGAYYRISTATSFRLLLVALALFGAGTAYFSGAANLRTCVLLAMLTMLGLHLVGAVASVLWVYTIARRVALDLTD